MSTAKCLFVGIEVEGDCYLSVYKLGRTGFQYGPLCLNNERVELGNLESHGGPFLFKGTCPPFNSKL